MAKVKSIKTSRKAVDTNSRMKIIQPTRLAFDPTKTLAALRIIAKKRDPELRKKILAASRIQTKKQQKKLPSVLDKRILFFNSSLPMRVTPEAQEIIRQLKGSSKDVIKFPENMINGGEVVCINNSLKPATKRVIGIFRKLYIETDPMKMDLSQMGIFVQPLKSDPKLLEFIVKVPSLPGILQARKFNDQGGLTHQLRISRGNK